MNKISILIISLAVIVVVLGLIWMVAANQANQAATTNISNGSANSVVSTPVPTPTATPTPTETVNKLPSEEIPEGEDDRELLL